MTLVVKTSQLVIRQGDCLDIMRTRLSDCSVDAIITDPPYGLGFMGKQWDTLPPGEEWAKECLRVLKPGGHILAFGGTRTWHRLAVAIEDAGFEMRDSIAWMHGQGFPKGKAQLKPAFEPIVVARKTGASPWLNVDACRIGTEGGTGSIGEPNRLNAVYGNGMGGLKAVPLNAGRWPANVVLDEAMAEVLDEQSGITKGRVGMTQHGSGTNNVYGTFERTEMSTGNLGIEDSGGASRFFYVAKAPSRERPKVDGVAHPTVKPLALMRWLVRLVTPLDGLILDPFLGSGTTAQAAVAEGFRCYGIERESDYIPLIRQRLGLVDEAS